MDKYKKKSFKFMGFSRDLRNQERNSQRTLSRHQRFSLLRPLDDAESTPDQMQKNEECSSRIPVFGKPKAPAVTRVEMLQKWKQEKMLKKQQESRLKKPTFKVAAVEHKPPPVMADKPLFAVDMTSSRSFKSRLQTSQFQSEKNQSRLAKKPENKETSQFQSDQHQSKLVKKPENDMSRMANDNKMSHLQLQSKLVNKPEISNTPKLVPNNKNLKPLSTNKTVIPKTFESKLAKNKDSSALPTFSNKARGLPAVDDSKNKIRQDQSSIVKKQPVLFSRLKEPSKISSGLCKPKQPLAKVPEQTSQTDISKKSTSAVQDTKSNQKAVPVKNNIAKNIPVKNNIAKSIPVKNNIAKNIPVKNIAKSTPVKSGTATSKLKDPVYDKGDKREENKNKSKEKVKDNNAEEDSDIPLLCDPKNITFRCEISYIEPVENVRKSFAPDGFVFRPPIELNSSLFLDDGPSSIFTRIKNEHQRTSTPKQNDANQQQEPKKDIGDIIVSSENKKVLDAFSFSMDSVFITGNDVLEDPVTSIHKDELQSSELSTSNQEITFKDSDPALEKSENTFHFEKSESTFHFEKSENTFHFDALEKETVDTTSKKTQCTTEKPELLTIEDINPSKAEELQNLRNDKSNSNDFIPVKNNGLTSNYELRTRNFRRSEKPALESINESLETDKTPRSSRKKPVLNTGFTPRRSLRLAKLSYESSSLESLLDVKRPTLFGTPEKDEISKPCHSGLTYDFEKLELEDCSQFRAAHPRKVSLLYTPPLKGKPSMCKKSLNGDLMSFSPSM